MNFYCILFIFYIINYQFISFVFEYKPKIIGTGDTTISHGEKINISLESMLNAFVDYESEDIRKYYTNILEIDARQAELEFLKKVQKSNLNDRFSDFLLNISHLTRQQRIFRDFQPRF